METVAVAVDDDLVPSVVVGIVEAVAAMHNVVVAGAATVAAAMTVVGDG